MYFLWTCTLWTEELRMLRINLEEISLFISSTESARWIEGIRCNKCSSGSSGFMCGDEVGSAMLSSRTILCVKYWTINHLRKSYFPQNLPQLFSIFASSSSTCERSVAAVIGVGMTLHAALCVSDNASILIWYGGCRQIVLNIKTEDKWCLSIRQPNA